MTWEVWMLGTCRVFESAFAGRLDAHAYADELTRQFGGRYVVIPSTRRDVLETLSREAVGRVVG